MKKHFISILILLVLLATSLQIVFAEYEPYSYNDGKIKLSIDTDKWAVCEPSDRERIKQSVSEESAEFLCSFFDMSNDNKVLAFNPDVLWYLAIKDGADTKALSSFSTEEIRSLNLNDFSDEEILNMNLTEGIAENVSSEYSTPFDPNLNDVRTFRGTKYAVGGGNAQLGEYYLPVRYYMSIVNGYYYMFTAYALKSDFTDDIVDDIESVLNFVQYKSESLDTTAKDESASADENANTKSDYEDRNIALTKALKAVIFAAPLYILIGIWIKKLKKKAGKDSDSHTDDNSEKGAGSSNTVTTDTIAHEAKDSTIIENDDSIEANKTNPDNANETLDVKSELKKYKDLLDEGLISQEDYDKLKARTLEL